MILLLSQALPPQGLNFSPADATFRREILTGERLAIGSYEAVVSPDGRVRLRDGRRVPAVRRTIAELSSELGLFVRRVTHAGIPLLNPDRSGQILRVGAGASLAEALTGFPDLDSAFVLNDRDGLERVVRADWSSTRLKSGDALFLISAVESRAVSLVGGVARPGAFEWREGATLGDAISVRGGLAARAIVDGIAVEREGRRLGPLSLSQDAAFALKPGDLVRVPLSGAVAVYVSVAGYVKRPGLVELRPGAKLSDVIADAGGLTVAAERVVVQVRSIFEPRRKPLLIPATEIASAPPLKKGDVIEIGAPPPKESK